MALFYNISPKRICTSVRGSSHGGKQREEPGTVSFVQNVADEGRVPLFILGSTKKIAVLIKCDDAKGLHLPRATSMDE